MVKQKLRGFTLIELIIVIGITAIIASISSVIVATGFNLYFSNKELSDITWEADLALERMGRELRNAYLFSVINPTQINFTTNDGNNINYSLAGSLLRRQANGGPVQPLTDNVSALSLNYYDVNLVATATPANVYWVNCDLTLSRSGGTVNMRTSLHPRN